MSATRKTVFVIHDRNEALRVSLFAFLRAIGLHPLEWSQLVESTGEGTPSISRVLDAAFNKAQAIVALFTPDDVACLRPELRTASDADYETVPIGQARPNVLFETGMAFGHASDRTIIVEVGSVRPYSDVAGRHVVRLSNDASKRKDLASRLKSCGCSVDLTGNDWLTTGIFFVDTASENGDDAGRLDLLRDKPQSPPLE